MHNMNNNADPSLSKLLKNGTVQLSDAFLDSLLDIPNPNRNSIIEMILEQLNGFQEDQFVSGQIFPGVVYAPNPFYFLLFFEKTSIEKTYFKSIRQSSPNGWIRPMQIKIYDEDEHNRIIRASLNLPINWRAELNSMNYN
jgi:hypothetical protein